LPADATIKRATICQQADGWSVSLCVETDIVPLPVAVNVSVGMDVGIKALATLSTGETIANPRHLQQAQHRLARLQRAVSRKKKGSNNRRKAINKLARQHLKVRYCRQDYLHKLTTRLIREHQAIITERLNIAGMLKNHSLARSIADASWGELNRQLAYKALWYGRSYEQVAPHHTSQDCSVCSYRYQELNLAMQEWTCPEPWLGWLTVGTLPPLSRERANLYFLYCDLMIL
jgi:putative transposase